MTLRTKAEIYVETLEETRIYERESRRAWLRSQLKARIRRFVEEFRTGFQGSPRPLVRSRKTAPRYARP